MLFQALGALIPSFPDDLLFELGNMFSVCVLFNLFCSFFCESRTSTFTVILQLLSRTDVAGKSQKGIVVHEYDVLK